MKNLVKTHNIIKPVRVAQDVEFAMEETIEGELSWTAAMPKGELAKLKKVCKPVAAKDGMTFWVLDDSKVRFVRK